MLLSYPCNLDKKAFAKESEKFSQNKNKQNNWIDFKINVYAFFSYTRSVKKSYKDAMLLFHILCQNLLINKEDNIHKNQAQPKERSDRLTSRHEETNYSLDLTDKFQFL